MTPADAAVLDLMANTLFGFGFIAFMGAAVIMLLGRAK